MKTIIAIIFLSLSLAACSGAENTASQPPAPQQAIAQPSAPPTAPSGEIVSFGGLSFVVPATWEEQKPTSRMRVAQYAIPSSGHGASECVLFHFPGMGGSIDANLQRWYGQFSQPDGSNTADLAKVESFQANGLDVTVVRVTGTYSNSMGPMAGTSGPQSGFAMAAGVVETANGPWFLKCVGPEAAIEAATPEVRGALSTSQSGMES